VPMSVVNRHRDTCKQKKVYRIAKVDELSRLRHVQLAAAGEPGRWPQEYNQHCPQRAHCAT